MILVVKKIASLIIGHLHGELSFAEQQELEAWRSQSPSNEKLLEQITNDESLQKQLSDYYEAEEAKDIIWKKINEATEDTSVVIPLAVRSRWKFKYAIAAVTIATLITAGAYMVLHRTPRPVVTAVAPKSVNDVLPGGNKAVLTLQSGEKIILDDAADGVIAREGSSIVNKTKNGELEYKTAPSNSQSAVAINTLATPKGGQFQIVLPDGSKVWLNAVSSITYPTAFTGASRTVSITGEAYFEVARDPAKPFKVHFASNNREGEVEVLGTHFNVNAYDDEAVVKTTLLEGKVKISAVGSPKPAILRPGEQVSINQSSNLSHPITVETEETVAWKNGEFLFRKAGIETLLKQAARWYDLEIEYPHGKPTDLFTGGVARNVDLGKFLTILEMSEVKCKLEGKKLIVYK